ncbi:HNH endonuclease [Gordonia terrae]|uniref:HNH endonuclease signature motif containing protein n=1 Tax=Gordonia terrae TaxID=2055 RepID=UPI003F6B8833
MFDDADPASLSDEMLEHRVLGYAAQITALTAQFLGLVAEWDERHGWSGPGIASCAHWLSWKAGISMRTAHEQVRVARALVDLSLIREAFAQGRLTYSKVRALTRVATPERELELVNLALSTTASQLDRAVRAMRHIDRNRGVEEDSGPLVESTGRWRWNADGSLSVSLTLSPLDGARFLAGAVRAEYERTRISDDPDLPTGPSVPRNTESGSGGTDSEVVPSRRRDLWRQVPSNLAPAVVVMADMVHDGIAMPDLAPGAEILIHAGEGVEQAHLDDGPALSDDDLAEARCGATARDVVSRRVAGQPGRLALLGVGRRKRVPNKVLVRALLVRDRCCQVPGCGRTRHLHAHHVEFWSAGGRTDPDNLILLCGSCHRSLHRGEFSITAHGGQRFTFHRPDGAEIEVAPPTSTPTEWRPNPRISTGATVPVGGGRMDLGYTTEVLYAVWEWKQRNETRTAPVVPEAA